MSKSEGNWLREISRAGGERGLSVCGMTWAERRVDVPPFVRQRELGLAC